jgi:hypothetical protein
MKLTDIKTGERYYIKGVSGWSRDYWAERRLAEGHDRGGYATIAEDQTDAYIQGDEQKRKGVRVVWNDDRINSYNDGLEVVVATNRVIATVADWEAKQKAEQEAKEEANQQYLERRQKEKVIADGQEAKCEALGIPYYRGMYSNVVEIKLGNDEIIALVEAAQKVEA